MLRLSELSWRINNYLTCDAYNNYTKHIMLQTLFILKCCMKKTQNDMYSRIRVVALS